MDLSACDLAIQRANPVIQLVIQLVVQLVIQSEIQPAIPANDPANDPAWNPSQHNSAWNPARDPANEIQPAIQLSNWIQPLVNLAVPCPVCPDREAESAPRASAHFVETKERIQKSGIKVIF